MKRNIPKWKKDEVKEIKKLITEYPYFGIVDLENLPALQFQRMRINLEGKILVKVTKKRLIKIALNELKDSKPNMEGVLELMKGMVALIFTKESPFRLYSLLAKSKTKAPAKPGQTAPSNIIIPAGPTPFAPGPVISELASVGIKTSVQEGKLVVKEDVVVAKEGEKIKPKVAEILLRLGIEPMEVGLNLIAVYDNGIIYKKDVLAVDEEAYYMNIVKASAECIALSMHIGYVTKENLVMMITKAERESRSLAHAAKILTPETAVSMLASAEREMEKIKSQLPEGVVEEISKTEFDKVLEQAKAQEKVVEDAYKTLMEGGSLT
ncbi:MAG: 50S ribosomal protein L10 [Candidatus Nanoarchaeia archaeon]